MAAFEIFKTALRLGCTSFGGPVAHLGYFRAEYVERRRWLSEEQYADLVALCQFLPGPASSQTGFAIGLIRGGLAGGLAAFLGFTLPSMLAMIGFAYSLAAAGDLAGAGWVRGMKAAAVAVVAHAVVQMARTLCPDRPRAAIAFAACAVMLHVATPWAQVLLIGGGVLLGTVLLRSEAEPRAAIGAAGPRGLRVVALILFGVLLVGLPLLAGQDAGLGLSYFDSFYRSGALVFGGGHVVLPLLESEFVVGGIVGRDEFLAGYGAAQAVPGPLFTFASFLGAAAGQPPNGILGGLLGTLGIFLPSLLLVYGLLPFWDRLRRAAWAQAGLRGANAVVVGLLLAALYDPVFTASVTDATAFVAALGCFLLLSVFRQPAWVVVVCAAAAGFVVMA